MNFNIDLSDIGGIPLINIVIIGVFVLTGILMYRLPEIIKLYLEHKRDTR